MSYYDDITNSAGFYLYDNGQDDTWEIYAESINDNYNQFLSEVYVNKNKANAEKHVETIKNEFSKIDALVKSTPILQDNIGEKSYYEDKLKTYATIRDNLLQIKIPKSLNSLEKDLAESKKTEEKIVDAGDKPNTEVEERKVKEPIQHKEPNKTNTLTEQIESTNSAKDIVLHVNAETPNAKEEYDSLQHVAGFKFPILKVRNTTFTKPVIEFFTMKVGYSFIPDMLFVIADENKQFLNTDYPIVNDIVTVYIGNQYDTINKPVHLDFRISKSDTVEAEGKIYHMFYCELAIANAFANLAINDKTDSISVIKQLCSELKLGFVTNLKKTDDIQVYRQNSQTNIEFLQDVCSKIYVDDEAILHCFIDQHFRLNVIDVDTVLNSRLEYITIDKDLTFFNDLDKPQNAILNNNMFSEHGTEFQIVNLVPTNNAYTNMKQTKPIESAVIKKDYSSGELSTEVVNTNVVSESQNNVIANSATNVEKVQTVSAVNVDNDIIKQRSALANAAKTAYLIDNNFLTVELQKLSNLWHLHKLVPLMYYSSTGATEIPLTPNDNNLDAETLQPISTFSNQELIDSLSDTYTIAGIQWLYDAESDLKQLLKLVRHEYVEQTYNLEDDLADATIGQPDPYVMPAELPMPKIESNSGTYSYNGSMGNWLQVAEGELGQAEVSGSSHNPRIQEYHKASGFGLTADETPWCASFVAWCMLKAGYTKPPSAAAAISWSKYGVPCEPGTKGAIVVMKFKPGPITPSGNHVAFCTGMQGNKVLTIGGNQTKKGTGGAVTKSAVDASRIFAWRLPQGSPSGSISRAANNTAAKGPLKISSQGLKFIKDKEGCKLKAYQCSADRWTIGYGHTKTARQGMTISYAQADTLLATDITFFENAVNNLNVKLTQAMFDALVSYTFNCGTGKIGKSTALHSYLKKGKYKEAADCLLKPNTAKGQILKGLSERRNAERSMFMSQGLSPA